ncbi:MAG TPA: GWxTD domain-containing protein [Gemmatimonadales bacterium]|nr:GWxTD domain-containing protein [Gemmatimonadales bacterium]
MLDAGALYRAMGFLVAGSPLPFVATVHYLADASPDSTLVVFALSLANHALSFQREGREFVAQYHVEVAFVGDSANVRQFTSDETVRVPSFPETQRSDESVIYQQIVAVRPGTYRLSVTVRDRYGPAVAHQERADTVPRFAGQGVSAPLVVYAGRVRTRRDTVPQLLVNPRALVRFGADSVRLYVEAYGTPRGARLAARALDQSGRESWRDTVALAGDGTLAAVLLVIGPGDLPVGQGRFEVAPVGAGADARRAAPFLVSFSDQWAITSYDEMISLLRYFERQDWVDSLRRAPPDRRPDVWRRFYKATDPNPQTPQNEALDLYFQRLQIANQRYREGAESGWLTDRGEVYITLGDPDDVYDFSTEVSRSGVRGIRWAYHQLRLTLFFQDQTGFGRFRLTALSRAEYERVLAQLRRAR